MRPRRASMRLMRVERRPVPGALCHRPSRRKHRAMPDLLLELFSEEIPARMQRRAAEDLRRLVTDALVERGFVYEGAKRLRDAAPSGAATSSACRPSAPRRARGAQGPARRRARSGASKASCKSGGPDSLAEAKIEHDPKKGEFYVAVDREARPRRRRSARRDRARHRRAPSRGRSPCAGARPRRSRARCAGCARCTPSSAPSGRRRRSRRSCRFAVDGIAAGDMTRGHRFMAPAPIQRAPLRRLRGGARAAPRSCSMPTAARISSCPMPEPRLRAAASIWSRTRRCSRRSPASSNGRWC